MVLGGLRTSPYLLDRVQPFMADNVFCSCGGAYLDGRQQLSSWGAAAEALRLFGGAAVFGVLLEGSWSSVWTGISGNWTLWILFFVILAIDAVLLTRMGIKRDRLAALGGLTPFIMLVAASLAVFETTGVSSAIFVSIFAAFLPWQLSGEGTGAIPTC